MGRQYPPFQATPAECAEWYRSNPVPHPLEEPYSCSCIACEAWYEAQLTPAVPGTLVIGIELDLRKGGSGYGSNSWRVDEEFTWGNSIRKPSVILGEMPAGSSGSHLKRSRATLAPVVVLTPDMGARMTPRMWLRVL